MPFCRQQELRTASPPANSSTSALGGPNTTGVTAKPIRSYSIASDSSDEFSIAASAAAKEVIGAGAGQENPAAADAIEESEHYPDFNTIPNLPVLAGAPQPSAPKDEGDPGGGGGGEPVGENNVEAAANAEVLLDASKLEVESEAK